MRRKYLVYSFTLLFILVLGDKISAQDNQLYTNILKIYVKDGLVDYKNLVGDKQLDKYLKQLSETNPDNFSRNEKLAFWINVYNVFTIQIVRDNYPIESINELSTGGRIIGHLLGKTVWDKVFITINNKNYSLNDIEHKILRKMNEPRIHFAIVCASISCPELLNEAYEADKIDAQLESQAKIFLNDESRNQFAIENRKASISEIFNWFGEDFGKSDDDILIYVSKFLSISLQTDINQNIKQWEVSFKDYNWNLNEIK